MLDYTTKGQNMRFNDEEKRRMLEEVIEENTSIKDVAFKYGIN
ncbi:MAG: transposase, partial [Spirochaetales bacterium]|nr:transposase [Spirochaetales bacterium]